MIIAYGEVKWMIRTSQNMRNWENSVIMCLHYTWNRMVLFKDGLRLVKMYIVNSKATIKSL